MKFIDLFAGIGGFRYGLQKVEIESESSSNHESGASQHGQRAFHCVWSNEWDKYASQIYKKHYGECDTRDIRTVDTKAPDIFSLKMLRGYLVMTKEKLSRQYLGFSPICGMSINGKFLTARISESLRTGRECSLSDILEKQVDQKYFLSVKATQFLIRRSMQNKQEGRGFRARLMPVMDPSEMPEKPTSTISEALKENEICG